MSQETRDRILGAAGPVFAQHGFETATVRDICERAGVNLASVNYHFGDKHSLYLETVRRAHQLRVQQVPLPAADPDTSWELRLETFIKTLLSRMVGVNAEPWQTRLLMREVLQPSQACREMVEDYFRPQTEHLHSILRDGLNEPVPAAELRRLAFSIIGQCLFYRVAGDVVTMLSDGDSRALDLDELTTHIARFSCGAIASYSNASPTAPITEARRS